MAFLKRLVMAVASGYILMFFSELYFINEGPALEVLELGAKNPFALLPWFIEMTLWYAGCAYVFLIAIGLFRVRSYWGLSLVMIAFQKKSKDAVLPIIK